MEYSKIFTSVRIPGNVVQDYKAISVILYEAMLGSLDLLLKFFSLNIVTTYYLCQTYVRKKLRLLYNTHGTGLFIMQVIPRMFDGMSIKNT